MCKSLDGQVWMSLQVLVVSMVCVQALMARFGCVYNTILDGQVWMSVPVLMTRFNVCTSLDGQVWIYVPLLMAEFGCVNQSWWPGLDVFTSLDGQVWMCVTVFMAGTICVYQSWLLVWMWVQVLIAMFGFELQTWWPGLDVCTSLDGHVWICVTDLIAWLCVWLFLGLSRVLVFFLILALARL